MDKIYISLLLLFAVFGAFCFNAGHKRAHRVVLKALLLGQLDFVDQRISWLEANRGGVEQSDFTKCCISYHTVGRLVLGWYRYFANVRNDKELKSIKGRMTERLGKLLSILESVGSEKNLKLDE